MVTFCVVFFCVVTLNFSANTQDIVPNFLLPSLESFVNFGLRFPVYLDIFAVVHINRLILTDMVFKLDDLLSIIQESRKFARKAHENVECASITCWMSFQRNNSDTRD